jgi:MoaA/NifB/PqqE/SkfB family radical SAM enzyme
METVIISEGSTFIRGRFDKHFENDQYEVYFNTQTGFEVLKGKDGMDPFKTELPLLIDVGIMGSCLNSCTFCYQGRNEEPHMTLDNFKILIDQVKHHVNQVALGGRGDPNLHPQFKEIVEYARENGVIPNYTTSGCNLTDEQIEISKSCGAVAVSDYRTPDTYSALERLMDAGIKTNIHLIFSRHNYDRSMKIIYGYNPWLKTTQGPKRSTVDINRLNAVVFLLFKPQGQGSDRRDMIPTTMQIKAFAESAFKPKAKFKIGMDSCLINHVLKYTEANAIQKMSVDTCESSRMSVYISPSMQLIPCSFADHPEWGVQITKKQDINYIWNRSHKFKQFRKRLEKNPCSCPVGL